MQALKLTKKYEKYPEYKDSGVEWLGNIPKEWNVEKLKYISVMNGKTLSEDTPPDFKFKYFDIGSVDGQADAKIEDEISFANSPSRARRLVSSGDSIISTVRTYLKAISHFDVVRDNIVASTGFAVLTPREKLCPKYLYYYLLSDRFIKQVIIRSKGVSYPAITPIDLKSLEINYPSKEEQEKIAKYLDEKISSINQIVERKEKLIDFLQEKRTAQIKRNLKSLNVRGKEYTKEKIKHVIKSIESGVWGENPLGNADDVKCLRVADFDYANLSFSDVETIRNNEKLSKRKILQYGDILVEKSGGGEKTPVGRAILFNSNERMVCTNFVDVVRVDRNKILPDFLVLYLSILYSERINTKYIKQNTGIQNMDIKAYFGEMVAFPDLKVQKEIVYDIQKKMALFDQSIKKVEKTIDFLKEFKSSLISNVVTGKIRV